MCLKIRYDGESEKFCKIFWEVNKALCCVQIELMTYVLLILVLRLYTVLMYSTIKISLEYVFILYEKISYGVGSGGTAEVVLVPDTLDDSARLVSTRPRALCVCAHSLEEFCRLAGGRGPKTSEDRSGKPRAPRAHLGSRSKSHVGCVADGWNWNCTRTTCGEPGA